MQVDYIVFFGLVFAVAVFTGGGTYFVYRQGIALRMIGIVIGMTAAAAVAGFMFGKAGLNWVAMGVSVGVILPAYLLMLLMIRRVIDPVKEISQNVRKIAVGELNQQIHTRSWDEIQDMLEAFTSMNAYLESIAATAEKVASGDLAVEVKLASEGDMLGKAFMDMIRNLRQSVGRVAESADALGKDYGKISGASLQASQAVDQINDHLQQVTRDTAQQMGNLDTTMASVKQMILRH